MRKLPSKFFALTFVSLATLTQSIVSSCSEEDNTIPSYRTDLLCATIDADSLVSSLILDDGHTYSVKQHIKAKAVNCKLRCYTSYSVSEDSANATVYEIAVIPCKIPLPADSFSVRPQQPVNVVSVWKSPGYINLCLAPMVNQGIKCQYDICIDTLISRTLHTSFLFEKTKDAVEAYTTKFYHSIPLQSPDYIHDFDSLSLTIQTYDGPKKYLFAR